MIALYSYVLALYSLILALYSLIITPNIKVDQLSANRIDQEIDQTHLRNINSDKGEKDFKIWKNTVEERKRDSKLLQ